MNKTILWILTLISSIFYSVQSYAQDIQFSQFYANVLYLNPAFTGSAHATRIVGHQRLQWPGLDANYLTSFISLDHYFNRINSGIGIYFMNDKQGTNILSSNEMALLYAYELPLNDKFTIRFGAKTNFVSRNINYAVLTFPDQFNNNGYVGPTGQNFGNDRITFLDLSSGIILYADHFWGGIAFDHMNNPNQSFYKNDNHLPSKFDFTGGYRFDIQKKDPNKLGDTKNDIYITPTAHYKFQGKSDQFDIGLYILYNQLITGLWYRGLPYIKNFNNKLPNNESFVAQIGYKINHLSLCYSYDQTVSKLYQGGTYGSHEINITYIFGQGMKKKKIVKRIPCPDFK
jgi:type IX secretion system PorP/SprF family membrane protein